MKTRKSNSYVKIGLYLLGGALVGGVLGVGAYMFLDNWGAGAGRNGLTALQRTAGIDSAGSGSAACLVCAGW